MASKIKSSHNHLSMDRREMNEFTKKILLTEVSLDKFTTSCKQGLEPNKNQVDLPVIAYKSAFFKLLNDSQSILIIGETGSGKTTQIPQWCLEYCRRKMKGGHVACTQPRRIAAMSVAARVAKERQSVLGKEVGYEVRFEAKCSPQTRLVYLTDGMLLREATFNKDLNRYGVIILDEAHERTLQTEILFGIIKRAMIERNAAANTNGDDTVKPLKVVIMSATINVKLFKKFFEAPILHIEGRQHSVHNMTTEVNPSDLLMATLICVFQIHRNNEDGDILVFCSGQDEIQTLVMLTKKALKFAETQPLTGDSLLNLIPLPLYASLPAFQQMQVFDRRLQIAMKTTGFSLNGKSKRKSSDDEDYGDSDDSFSDLMKSLPSSSNKLKKYRRVIYATNVAETSVTIPNIKYVIDTGKVKCRSYCPRTGLESLKVANISKAQAEQRAGRAGRTSSGICYRLYTTEDYDKMNDYMAPEIKRCNLESVLLQLLAIDSDNIKKFEFLERPDDDRIKAALRNLLSLKAIVPLSSRSKPVNGHQQNGVLTNGNSSATPSSSSPDSDPDASTLPSKTHITPATLADDNALLTLSYDLTSLGNKMRRFPLHPSMARAIIAAHELGCLDEALTVVSLLSIENLFHIPPSKQAKAEEMLSKFHSNEGDTIMLLNVFRAFRRTSILNRAGLRQWCVDHFIHIKNLKMARLIRKQLLQITRTHFGWQSSSCSQDTSILRRALTYGLFNNIATMWDGKYRNKTSNKEIYIHPSSCLFKTRPECILYVEVVETNKCYMRNCTLIDMNWVREVSSTTLKSN